MSDALRRGHPLLSAISALARHTAWLCALAVAGAAAAGSWFADRRFGALATLLGVLLAADRVSVGAHYGLDALGGLMLGAAAAVGRFALLPLLSTVADWLATTPLRPLLLTRSAPVTRRLVWF